MVPPSRSAVMVEALRRKGNPVGCFMFSGKQHGSRKAANISRCLDAELTFYAIELFKIGMTLPKLSK
jgi:dipeptidyl aminopeptidase/acylaminoacyl peptidase